MKTTEVTTPDWRIMRVKSLTRGAAQRVDELIFKYGHLDLDSPERAILASKIRDILSDWADQVYELGGTPQELWTVSFNTPRGVYRWQYPCSRFVEFRQST